MSKKQKVIDTVFTQHEPFYSSTITSLSGTSVGSARALWASLALTSILARASASRFSAASSSRTSLRVLVIAVATVAVRP